MCQSFDISAFAGGIPAFIGNYYRNFFALNFVMQFLYFALKLR